MHKLLVFITILFAFSSFGQSGEWWKRGHNKEEETKDTIISAITEKDTVSYQKGEVKISQDPRIEKLIKFKGAKIPPAIGPKRDGFRVQLFFDQDRKAVDEARSKMLQLDGNADTYIEYKAPNYNLLLGNYRTRLDAEKVRATLLEEFPEAIIVKDRIYFPEIKEDKD
tara:strand:+ start:47610 stop:48113 length:504 start_codon:yes stop_codon:yes gene_type:complete